MRGDIEDERETVGEKRVRAETRERVRGERH